MYRTAARVEQDGYFKVRQCFRTAGQDFAGDFTLQLLIFGSINFAESTLTKQRGSLVRTELRTDRYGHFGAYFIANSPAESIVRISEQRS